MATALQTTANRENAKLSTGPATPDGKLTASGNAIRHGLCSQRIILDNEDPDQYAALLDGLVTSFAPVGAIEDALVEKIAICLWRQRRLVAAETAELQLQQRPSRIARDLGWVDEPGIGYNVDIEELETGDDDQLVWCRDIIAEVEAIEMLDLEAIESEAPKIFAQLQTDAGEDHQQIEAFLEDTEGGLRGYVVDLVQWCQSQIEVGQKRPQLLHLVEQLRGKRLLLDAKQLEVIARYQTTLDNQLYKALRAFREAQDWRIERSKPGEKTEVE